MRSLSKNLDIVYAFRRPKRDEAAPARLHPVDDPYSGATASSVTIPGRADVPVPLVGCETAGIAVHLEADLSLAVEPPGDGLQPMQTPVDDAHRMRLAEPAEDGLDVPPVEP